MSSPPFLDLRHIRKEFGSFTALQDINLEIRQGEFVCFLGPSGCGKTTLLRIIAGLEVQTSGQLSQGGQPTIMFTENVATFMSENIDDFSENEKCSLRLFVENFVQQTYLDNIRATVRNGVKV